MVMLLSVGAMPRQAQAASEFGGWVITPPQGDLPPHEVRSTAIAGGPLPTRKSPMSPARSRLDGRGMVAQENT
jgi:hypothetical protein